MKVETIFKYYSHLGNFYPYYFKDMDWKFVLREKLKEIHTVYPDKNELDITALNEILNKNYILGDRTLIKCINRSPWMARPDKNSKYQEFAQFPDFGIYF